MLFLSVTPPQPPGTMPARHPEAYQRVYYCCDDICGKVGKPPFSGKTGPKKAKIWRRKVRDLLRPYPPQEIPNQLQRRSRIWWVWGVSVASAGGMGRVAPQGRFF